MAKISVIGAGSWGTALAVHLDKNGHEVTLWSILDSEVKMLQEEREQKDKLPGVKISEKMHITKDLKEAITDKDVVVLAVPSTFIRSTAAKCASYVAPGQIVVDAAKGIEENTLLSMTEIIAEEIPQANVAVLSGPSHAEEVGRGIPTTIVVGAKDQNTAVYLQNIFMNAIINS